MRQIIFDLDDTLYKNKQMREKRERAILEFLGPKKARYLELKKNNGTLESLRMLGVEKKDFYRLINQVDINLARDGRLIELIQKLKKDFKMIVLSNNSEHCVKTALEKLGILDLIDEIYTGEDFEHPKPSPECFFMVGAKDICVGDDFEKDLEYPRKKGALTIHIGNSKKADFRISNIYLLGQCIDKIKIHSNDLYSNFSLSTDGCEGDT